MRFARGSAALALIAVGSLVGACGGQTGITTASVLGADATPAADTPGIGNADPMARPTQVAWTSARARRCGFYFDPAKLRATYLGYEAKQGAQGPQLAGIEKSYDATAAKFSQQLAGDPEYCTGKQTTSIKADLQRHLAGDYTPNLPEPKKVASSGFFDGLVSEERQEKFDAKKLWEREDEKARRR